MLSPEVILTWLERNVNGMRRSRMKTLAHIVPAAMLLGGVALHALGRGMRTGTTAKHNIKRVERFVGNAKVESMALAQGLFRAFAPQHGLVWVLADWTDVSNGKLLVFALPCNGRSIPFFTHVVPKQAGEGALVRAENEALERLAPLVQTRSNIVIVADRGFGNQRWLGAVARHGFHFVQRLSCVFFADTEEYIGALRDLNVRRGPRVRDWGHGTLGEDQAITGRLVTACDPKAQEPWYLLTDLKDLPATEVVDAYRRRWWIETSFRDAKNRDWGLGVSCVHLDDYRRYERLFYIVALAYILLSAHGAAAEAEGFDRGLKANTRKTRVLSLLRIGYHFIQNKGDDINYAVVTLRQLLYRQDAPNWG